MNSAKKNLSKAFLFALWGFGSNLCTAAILYPGTNVNQNLPDDNYFFAGAHSEGSAFLDELQFSMSDAGNIFATVNNASINPAGASPSEASQLLNTSFLTISLFDSGGNFITSAGAGGVLSATGLNGGSIYTLAISGKATGLFGGAYDGKLTVDEPPSEVPLPAALPAFMSSLLVLGWRSRKVV